MHDGCACVCAAFSQLCSRLGVPTEFAAWHVAGAARCVPLAEKRSQESREGRHPASPGDLQLNSPRLHPVPPRAPWGVAAWRLLQRLWADIVAICGLPEAGASHGMVQVSVITLSYLHSPPHPQPPNPYTIAHSRGLRPRLLPLLRAPDFRARASPEAHTRKVELLLGRWSLMGEQLIAGLQYPVVSGRIRTYPVVSGRVWGRIRRAVSGRIRTYPVVSGRISIRPYQAVSERVWVVRIRPYGNVSRRVGGCVSGRIRARGVE